MQYVCKIITTVDGKSIRDIYQAVGWDDGSGDCEILSKLAQNSAIFAGAFLDNGQMIGMGRVLSDNLSDACIQDIAVLPEFQCQGIGREIMRLLIAECKVRGIEWIQLIASSSGKKLYESLGFEVMTDFVPMKLVER